jgi:hypothetical protein
MAENTEENNTNPFESQISDSLAKAREAATRGKKGNSKSKPSATETGGGDLPPQIEARIETLFSEETWKPLVEIPFVALEAYSGRKEFHAEEKEIKTLAATTSMTVQYFAPLNPAYLALTMCAIAWTTILGGKALKAALGKRHEIEQLRSAKTS